MDVSKLYIEMCEKTQEIQEIGEKRKGFDFFERFGDIYVSFKYFEDPDQFIYVIGTDSKSEHYNFICKYDSEDDMGYIWLPRQDQLQDMIKGTIFDKINKFNKFFFPLLFKINPEIDEKKLEEFKKAWKENIDLVVKSLRKVPVIDSTEESIEFINISTNVFESIEQLWLAFIMKEKYNKIWKDGNWKNIQS